MADFAVNKIYICNKNNRTMMKTTLKLCLSVMISIFSSYLTLNAEPFNDGWTFWSDSQPKQTVRLPHDAMIHGIRSADVPGGNAVGYYSGEIYYYEKTFIVPDEWLDKHVEFIFGGAYKESKVYINGNLCGGIPNGYLPFTVSADKYLKAGKNTILVTCDNNGQRSSRWYSGGGIYRPVEIVIKDRSYISDVQISTISVKPAQIRVNTVSSGESIHVTVLDGKKVIAEKEGKDIILDIPDANLWDAENPYLYTIEVSLRENDQIKDTFKDTFGIRTIEWDNKGLYINGIRTLLRGGCIHSDNGILGAAEYDEAAERKIKILKNYGFNAIRSSHNGCSEAILKACDKYGMYIIDEPWDMWWRQKNPNDYGKFFRDHYINDIQAIVAKDFNHPSVIMYSIGNEVSEPTSENGLEMTKKIVSLFHSYDNTRPVTSGFNTTILASGSRSSRRIFAQESKDTIVPAKQKKSRRVRQLEWSEPSIPEGGMVGWAEMMRSGSISSEEFNKMVQQRIKTDDYMVLTGALDSIISPVLEELDIVGYNYAQARYPYEGNRHPEWLIYGSETYPQDIWNSWQMVKAFPYLIGDFMWTAWDYLGECGLGSWTYEDNSKTYPYKLSEAGVLDIIGNPTGEAFHAKVTWEDKPSKPYICVRPVSEIQPRISQWRGTNSIPSWTWNGKEGTEAVIEVFTSARRVKLYLNGKKIGSKRTQNGIATFTAKYEPGELKAKAYGFLFKVGEDVLNTAEGKSSIRLTTESTTVKPGQLFFVNVDIIGENKVIDSSYDKMLSAEATGGELVAFGSAVPKTEARFDSGKYPAHYGQALAAVYADKPGKITLKVSGDSIESQTIEFTVE